MSSSDAARDGHGRLIIEGGRSIGGPLHVGGSKNTVLPMMAAAVLAPGESSIRNVSVLKDVWTFGEALRGLGCAVTFAPDRDATTPETITIDATRLSGTEPPKGAVRAIRASFYLLGALLGRCGEGRVALPGGDAFGPRPVNLHLEGLKAFGAEVDVEGDTAYARAPKGRLDGGTFRLEPSSVGATINLLLAAVTARGGCRIENAAREPDIVVFGEMLQRMGARIEGLGTATIEVEGTDALRAVRARNAPDRIEAGTYMVAALLTGEPGTTVTILGAEPDHLGSDFLDAFRATGADATLGYGWIEVHVPDKIRAVSIETAPFPGFPTDLQAQWTVLMTQADGEATVTDPIYPDRFDHVPELRKMGADITVDGNRAIIRPSRFRGAEVVCADVRAGAALVLGGLIADGTTTVSGLRHLDRGYEKLEEKLAEAGAAIHREGGESIEMPDAMEDHRTA